MDPDHWGVTLMDITQSPNICGALAMPLGTVLGVAIPVGTCLQGTGSLMGNS